MLFSGRGYTLFTRQKKASSFQELLEIEFSGAPGAVAVFTTERKAIAYHRAHLTLDWELFTVPKSHLADLLDGYGHVVLNPSPNGEQGRALTVFQALVELT